LTIVRILQRKSSTVEYFAFSLIVLTKTTFRQPCSHGLEVEKLGKRKVISEENLENMMFPSANDVLGVAVKMFGFDRILVKCQDGKERLCRVRGKLKRRVWIRVGDVVLVSPWDFQSDTRGDIFWRYRKNQTEQLRLKGYLTMQ
jgi:translation initiation factor 1A